MIPMNKLMSLLSIVLLVSSCNGFKASRGAPKQELVTKPANKLELPPSYRLEQLPKPGAKTPMLPN